MPADTRCKPQAAKDDHLGQSPITSDTSASSSVTYPPRIEPAFASSFEMAQENGDEKFVGIDALEEHHRSVFRRALSNLLATEVAEFTYAQILDGLPTVESQNESHPRLEGHPVYELDHRELCAGSLDKAREFRAHFDPSVLLFKEQVVTIHVLQVCMNLLCRILTESPNLGHKRLWKGRSGLTRV